MPKKLLALCMSVVMALLEAGLGRISMSEMWDYSRYLRDVAAKKTWMLGDDDPVEIVTQ